MHESPHTGSDSTERQNNIEVWNDLVSPRDLIICLAVSAACAVAAVLLSSKVGGNPLFWGLGASVVGFAINCLLVTPKREVVIADEDREPGRLETAEGSAR
ncbi:hypothetical protein NSA19_09945 [Actinomyces bowdenii]|uniref:hypothetical protein n=1 Tax=Actinomyces bowdenii TaxID=131109 RepID=UPI00214C5573|nr:hypothetical protein [Actinomyces bowdenii]